MDMTIHDLVIGGKYILFGKEVICIDKGQLSNGSQEGFFKCRTVDDKKEISGTSLTMWQTIQKID